MKFCEKFLTIQAEGIYLGTPSLFLRTSGCNCRCEWKNPDGTISKCDTPYTSWSPETPTIDVTPEDIIEEMQTKYPNVEDVVITGGEPFLQPGISDFINKLAQNEFFVTVETNGTIYKETCAQLISMSPKLKTSIPDSGPERTIHEASRWKPEQFRKFYENNRCQFKFVFSNKDDIVEIDEFLKVIGFDPENAFGSQVILMPQGINSQVLKENSIEAIEVCKERGWRFSPRTHIDVWGMRRMV